MMIFTIVVLGMVGGFIVLLPITRRLGKFLEYRMSDQSGLQQSEQNAALLRAVEALRDDVARLAERQDFTERLLEKPRDRGEPRNDEGDPGPTCTGLAAGAGLGGRARRARVRSGLHGGRPCLARVRRDGERPGPP